MYAAGIRPTAWDYAPADSDFIRRRRTQPNVFCVSSLNTGSTINDLLPKRYVVAPRLPICFHNNTSFARIWA